MEYSRAAAPADSESETPHAPHKSTLASKKEKKRLVQKAEKQFIPDSGLKNVFLVLVSIGVSPMIAQPARLFRLFSLAITVLAIAACGSSPAVNSTPPAAAKGQRAAMVALEQVGVPYRYGGATPRGFDCSGLVQYSYSHAGVSVPRTTGQLWEVSRTVPDNQLRAGDILFFRIDGKMSHVGMYLGERRFVHSPQSGRSVSIGSLDAPFYKAAFIRAGRPY